MHATYDQTQPAAALELMLELKEALQDASSPQAQQVLDQCSLDLCAPLFLCGSLSPECASETKGLLKLLETHCPPREVYTGEDKLYQTRKSSE